MFKEEGNDLIISVYAKPNAKETKFLTIYNNALKISLHAVPEDGKANKELISYFSKIFNIPKNSITILKGETTQNKLVHIKNIKESEVRAILKI